MRSCLTLWIVVFFFTQNCFAQGQSGVISYNTNNGLASNMIFDLEEDQNGYLWMATSWGVSRFDGFKIENYSKAHGLADNVILIIRKDSKGRVWFLGLNNTLSYWENGAFYKYDKNALIHKFCGPNVGRLRAIQDVVVDEKEDLYFTIGIRDSLFKIQEDKVIVVKSAKDFKSNQNILVYRPKSFGKRGLTIQDINKKLDGYLFEIDENQDNIGVPIPHNTPHYRKLKNGLHALCNGQEFIIYDENKVVQKSTYKGEKLLGFYEDEHKNIWFQSSSHPLKAYNYQNNNWTSMKDGLEDVQFNAIIQDVEGNYWMASPEEGLLKSPKAIAFSIKHPNYNMNLVGLHDIEGTLFTANTSGEVFEVMDNKLLPMKNIVGRHPTARTIDFWVVGDAVFTNGVEYFYDRKLKKIRNAKGEIAFRHPKAFVSKNKDEVYIGTESGIYLFNSKTSVCKNVDTTIRMRILSMQKGRDGKLWVGTVRGVFSLENGKMEFDQELEILKDEKILSICSNPSALFFAVKGEGVLIKTKDSIYKIQEEDGLISNFVETLALQGDSILWAGGTGGLSRIKLNGNLPGGIVNFTRGRGLPGNEINEIVVRDDEVWLATSNGIGRLDPSAVGKNTIPPRLNIESVIVNGKSIVQKGEYQFKYNENNININFAGISFSDGSRIRYKYRLFDNQTAWETTNSRNILFSSLNPGEYRFELMAMNEDGVWNENPVVFEFKIRPHWTGTWWFRLLMALLILWGAYLIFTTYNKRQKEKFAIKARIAELQQHALSSNMNPHFIFNALNSIQSNIVQNRLELANEMLLGFSRLIRINLKTRFEPEVSLAEEIEKLEIYLDTEKLRFDNKLTYQITVEESIDRDSVYIPSMILQPFVENAIWHGILPEHDQTMINISAKKLSDDSIEIVIEDNGVGMNHEKIERNNHVSVSTTLTKERLKLLGQSTGKLYSVEINDKQDLGREDSGVLVRIILPLHLE